MTQHCNDYRWEDFCRTITVKQRTEALAFCYAEGTLANRREGKRRAFELFYLVRRSDEALVGMSTAKLKTATDGLSYTGFRMFLRQEDRVPYLMRIVANATRDVYRALRLPVPQPAKKLVVTEKPKLMSPGMRRYFHRHDYVFQARKAGGFDMWLAPFGDVAVRDAKGQHAA